MGEAIQAKPLLTPPSPRSPHKLAGLREQWSARAESAIALLTLVLLAAAAGWSTLAAQRPRAAAIFGLGRTADRPVRSAEEWERSPGSIFQAPLSRCSIHSDDTVSTASNDALLSGAPPQLPFLFNLSSQALPTQEQACGHCPPGICNGTALPYVCCGVCNFQARLCNTVYPEQGKDEAAAAAAAKLAAARGGTSLQAFSPCELFQRIRGRTLWLLGDSQLWNFYYAIECFLRELAPSFERTDPLPTRKQLKALTTARAAVCNKWFPVPPICLRLAHGTRLCAVRVDSAEEMVERVLPALVKHSPGFVRDIAIVNTGLHYFEGEMCKGGSCRVPGTDSEYVRALQQLASYREAHLDELPTFIWMDTPPQHFPGTGYWLGRNAATECAPFEAWLKGDPVARAGGLWNVAAAPLVGRLADAHLQIWNATVPLWDQHLPPDCTHFCHGGSYSTWVLLLNQLLRERRLGGPAPVRRAPSAAAARGGRG